MGILAATVTKQYLIAYKNDIEYKMIATGKFVEIDPSTVTEGGAGQVPRRDHDRHGRTDPVLSKEGVEHL